MVDFIFLSKFFTMSGLIQINLEYPNVCIWLFWEREKSLMNELIFYDNYWIDRPPLLLSIVKHGQAWWALFVNLHPLNMVTTYDASIISCQIEVQIAVIRSIA